MRANSHATAPEFDMREVVQGADRAFELHGLLSVEAVVGVGVRDVTEDAAEEVGGLTHPSECAHVNVGGAGDGE